MSDKYQELYDKNFPAKGMLETYVAYYGEEYRKQLQSILKNTHVEFFMPSFSANEIEKAFKKVYGSNSDIDYKEEAEYFYLNLQQLANHGSIFSELNLVKHAKVLTELGFNVSKILLKHKELPIYKLNTNSPETEKLKNYAKYSLAKKDINSDYLNIENFIVEYNKCADNKQVYNIHYVKDTKDEMAIHLDGKKVKKDYSDTNIDFPLIDIDNLEEQDNQFLQDLIKARTNILFLDNEFATYVLKGINKIFNKNFQSIEELHKDKSIEIFLSVKDMFSEGLDEFIVSREASKIGLVAKDKNNNTDFNHYLDDSNYLNQKPNALAATVNNRILIPLNKNNTVWEIMHEMNHRIANENGDFEKISTGFNEVVNEYLTLKAMEKVDKQHFKGYNFERSNGCSYHRGISILNAFLVKFEPILKKCQLGDGPEILESFIGKENFKTLMDFGNLIEDKKYGAFNIEVKYNNGIFVDSISQWLDYYKKHPDMLNDIQSANLADLQKFINYDNFVNQLVEHYEEFEKGNIINLSLKGDLSAETNNEV